MNKYIRCLSSLLLIVISCALSGCETGTVELGGIKDDNMEAAEEWYYEETSDVKSVGIYVDATPSMEGYIGIMKVQMKNTRVQQIRRQMIILIWCR